ncbi:hypothetical protein ENUP19_0216G0005 [Entamoeba nuttalli]|uniref:Type III restriction enzyme, res subunit protein n=2 Tax=Entamoeba nuttalli TaxID=412467 RepID=K2GWA7_ENTNP|nr:type III restriction enzyme, res subunit protein [Entamoeba nuttalli P19]EKE39498.1 type III restriction enzyme, res subunit protein [Entamoeba nuttalli P19]|eukprot:XP_008858168.1 type III restriction enzyme, res subunit protein [Entamoeba nuttalli P19]
MDRMPLKEIIKPRFRYTTEDVEHDVNQIFSAFGLTPHVHQMECLKKLLEDVQNNHSSNNYLMQHSTGSGKSLTIASLAHFLYNLHTETGPKYDKVIVLNDRVHLDTQLYCTVKAVLGVIDKIEVKRVKNSVKLQEDLEDIKCRIFCTTLQKFSFVETQLPSDLNIAIISDEAHRSHGAAATRKLHTMLSGEQRQNRHITYFSFTATPTSKCLRLFGTHKDGLIRPFHCFSLAEAESQGLVMNVLKNYYVVPKMFNLSGKTKAVDPIADGLQVAKNLSDEIRMTENLMKRRAEFIINHFDELIKRTDSSSFKGIAMLVCRTRKSVIKYTQMLRAVINEKGLDYGVFGAFSETDIDGVMESEEKLNTMYNTYSDSKHITELLKDQQKNIRIIVAADKLQTGFDEPRLMCMYVDKVLSGSHAVQTLGRLDRICKGKKEVYVVDFANQSDSLKKAWGTFYHEALLFESDTDVKRQDVFQTVKMRLKKIDGIKEQNIEIAKEAIKNENIERRIRLLNPVQTDMLLFLKLVDYFQDDNDRELKYSFISKLYTSISSQSDKTISLTQLLKSSLSVSVDETLEFNATHIPIVSIPQSAPKGNSLAIYQRRCKEMTSTEVVEMAEKMVDGENINNDPVSQFSNEIYSKNNRDLLRGIVNKYSKTPVKRKPSKKIEINAYCRQNIHHLLGWDKVSGTLRFLLKEVINSKILEQFIHENGIAFLFVCCNNAKPYEGSFGQAALQVILDCLKPVYIPLLSETMFDVNFLINSFCQNTKFLAAPALKILVRLCSLFPLIKKYVLACEFFREKLKEYSGTSSLFLKQAIDSFVRQHISV